MERTEYRETDRNEYVVYKEAKFKCNITEPILSFLEIINKFRNYHFTDHLDSLREEFDCQSHSHIVYYLSISDKQKVLFFGRFLVATLGIADRNEIDLLAAPINYERENIKEEVNDILQNKRYDKITVKAEMEIKFFTYRSLDILNQYEEEVEELFDEGYDDEGLPPAIVELPFVSDNCSICLSSPPSILNIPCLHLSVCSECEEAGKLYRCAVCREKIFRKVKI